VRSKRALRRELSNRLSSFFISQQIKPLSSLLDKVELSIFHMSKSLARLIVFLVIVFTGVAAYQITTLEFDYEFEHFFPSEDTSLDFYTDYNRKFSTDVDFVLLALKNDDGIFKKDFLLKAKSLREELIKVDEVKRVVSPFDARDYALGPFGPIAIPFLHPDDESRYAADSTRIYKFQKEVGSLFSEDAKSISMLIEIQPNLSKVETDTVYFKLKDVLDQYEFDQMHTAGKVIGQAYYIDQIKYEFTLFFILAVVLVVIILSLVYKSIWGVVVPLLIVVLSVIWSLGLMGLIGKPIDIMTALLPLILFVVGISDVIHLLSRYFEEIRNGLSKDSAIKIAYKQVGMATFLTSLTTALGFLTLLTSGIRPVRELGIYAAIGVFIAFILAFSLLPAILALNPVPKLAYKEPSSLFWNKLVRKLFFFSMRNQTTVLIASLAVVIVSAIGISRIEVDNYLLEDVAQDDPMRKSFLYFEDNFAGARPFELYVSVKDSTSTLFDKEVVVDMQRIDAYLKNEYGVGFLLSPLNILRTANQALSGGHDTAYVIPASDKRFNKVRRLVSKIQKRPEFNALLANKFREGRFSGKMRDLGGLQTKKMNEELIAHFEEYPLKTIDFRLTGMALLIDKNNETLSMNMMSGLIFALLVVAIIMGMLFRSVRMALITLVPNILPLMVIGGFMGLKGIDLKVSTSIIFGIAFGIAVDDSIHYLSKFKLELSKGRSMIWALRRTSISTGKAILLTSLILCSGFLTLSSSSFTSTHYVGLLISITLAVAVMADLVLLPVLLRKIYRK